MPRYTEQEAREAVRSSLSYSEALRKLGLRPVGGNHRVFRRFVDDVWRIPTDHFDPEAGRLAAFRRRPRGTPLDEVLVPKSTYHRASLKQRLYRDGLKQPRCELCGQGELWNGARMSLVLDHVNGVPDDNRLPNLRILCPNCNATLDTHCGRKNRVPSPVRNCAFCGAPFEPKYDRNRYCSRTCGQRHSVNRHGPKVQTRKVPRPSHEQLLTDLSSMSFLAVGRKCGVSDNAVRKWLRRYENHEQRERAAAPADVDPLDEAA